MEVQTLCRCWAPAPAAAAEQLLRRAGVPGVLTAADSTTGKTGGGFLDCFLCTVLYSTLPPYSTVSEDAGIEPRTV